MRLLPRMPLGLVVLLALALPSSALAGAQPAPIPHGRALAALAAEPRVLLGVERTPEARRALAAQGAAVVSPALGIWEVTGAEAARLVPQLERQGALRHAEPVYTREPPGQLGAADPLLSRAWHL